MDTKKVMLMFGIVFILIMITPYSKAENITFTSSQAGGWIVPSGVYSLEVLVVAGGGGGGRGTNCDYRGAGGGAGGLIYNSSYPVVPGQNLTVTIGAGGVGGITNSNGGDSVLETLTAIGGGKAGGANPDGAVGGSGGGGGSSSGSGGSGTAGQGNDGGDSGGVDEAGGGGGSETAGVAGVADGIGGNGGNGTDYSLIFGTDVGVNGFFAGGGGGTGQTTRGVGGLGGGADAGAATGGTAIANTGGGGGGGGGNTPYTGGAGGSGIIVILYNYSVILTANATYPDPASPSEDWQINITATDPDNLTFNAYTQFYINDTISGSELVFTISNDTNTNIANLSNTLFSDGAELTAEVWIGDGEHNNSKYNITDIADITDPVITPDDLGLNLTYIYVDSSSNLTGQINASDPNLYSINISIDDVSIFNTTGLTSNALCI